MKNPLNITFYIRSESENALQSVRLLKTRDVAFGPIELVTLPFLVLFTLRQTEAQSTEREGTQKPQV